MNMSEVKVISHKETFLVTDKIPGLFLKYALPGVIGLLFLGIQSVIDGILLGRFVGVNALASVNIILPCYSLMAALAIVMGVGCQTLIGISLGRSDRKEANNALTTLFFFLFGFAALISGTLYIFAEDVARILGASDVLVAGSVSYIRALVPFFPVMAIMFLGDYVLKVLGRPMYASMVMASTVVINIAFDLLFVVVLGWGIAGAGLGTGLAFTIGALCNVPYLFSQKQIISVQQGKFKSSLVWKAFYNGSSEGMTELSAGITVFLFNITMMKYLGESGVAAFTVINYVLFISITVFLGISDGIIPIISYNYGAKRPDRIETVLRLAARTNMTIGFILFFILFFFGGQIIGLFFEGDSPEVVSLASYGIRIYSFAFLLNGLNILSSSYFTAIGNAKISVVISLLRGLVFVLIGILVFPPVFGINSIWFDIPIAEACTLVVSAWLVKRSIFKLRKQSVKNKSKL